MHIKVIKTIEIHIRVLKQFVNRRRVFLRLRWKGDEQQALVQSYTFSAFVFL